MPEPMLRNPDSAEISPVAALNLRDALDAYATGDTARAAAALCLIDTTSWTLIRERLTTTDLGNLP